MHNEIKRNIAGAQARLYSRFLNRFLRATFLSFERLGIHVTPCHFYHPIPDTRALHDDLWTEYSDLSGVKINAKEQRDYLSRFESAFKKEYAQFPISHSKAPHQYYIRNGFFEAVDGEILYCMIRYFRPRRIIEVGSGFSTYLAAKAILKNTERYGSHLCELVAIDPYPNNSFKKGFPGLSRLIAKPVQKVPISEFEKLEENDMLLIDSSHTVKIGGDVVYEYLKIIPKLRKGVLVSCHDIFLPAEYPKNWVLKRHWFWSEHYLLHAFLLFNNVFEVIWMSSYMHLNHSERLKKAFASYENERDWPGSLWIRRTR